MKLIAGSILMGFSLLALTLGNLAVEEGGRTSLFPIYTTSLDRFMLFVVFLFIIAGATLMFWELRGVQR